jgi:phage/plasmid-associated DNA primase
MYDDAVRHPNMNISDACVIALQKELHKTRDHLISLHPNVKSKSGTKNPKGSILSKILCKAESDILKYVLERLGEGSYALIHDGLMIEKSKNITTEQLNQWTEHFGVTWKIKPFAKSCEDIPKTFNRIRYPEVQMHIVPETQEMIAKYIVNEIHDDVINQAKHGKVYIYDANKNLYMNPSKQAHDYVANIISKNNMFHNHFQNMIFKCIEEAESHDDEKKVKRLRQLGSKLTEQLQGKGLDSLAKAVTRLSMNDDKKFETKSNLLHFNNCCLDIRTGKTVPHRQDHYLYMSCGYDWVEPTIAEIDEIEKLMTTIHPDPDTRKSFFQYHSNGLSGEPLERFAIYNGSGRNGKGLISELSKKSLGDYYYQAQHQCVTKEFAGGPSPELANMHNKRMICMAEPDKGVVIRSGQMCALIGGGNINARGLYQGECDCRIIALYFMECNSKPGMTESNGPCIVDKLVDYPFTQSFVENIDDPDNKGMPNIHPQNKEFKRPEFQMRIRCAFIKYLVMHYQQYLEQGKKLFRSEIVKEATREYLAESYDFGQWWDETYEKDIDNHPNPKDILIPSDNPDDPNPKTKLIPSDNPDGYLTAKEISMEWKRSEYMQAMSIRVQNARGRSWVLKEIQNDIKKHPYFIKKQSKSNKHLTNFMWGWKIRPVECSVEPDELDQGVQKQ